MQHRHEIRLLSLNLLFAFVVAVHVSSGQARIAAAETGRPVPIRVLLNSEEGRAKKIQISDNGKIIAAESGAGTSLIDALSGRLIRKLSIDESEDVVSELVSISPNGDRLLSTQNDVFQLWDTTTGKIILSLKNSDTVAALMSMDGKSLATVWRDKTTLKLWDTETGALRASIRSGSSEITDYEFVPESRYVATLSKDRSIRIWDAQTGALVKSLASGSEEVKKITASKLHLLLIGKSSAQLWEIGSAKQIVSVKHNSDNPEYAFSRDGNRFYLEDKTGIGRVFTTRDGKQLASIRPKQNKKSILLSNDGNTIVSINEDGLQFFDANSGKEALPAQSFDGTYLGSDENYLVVKLKNEGWQIRELTRGSILASYGFPKEILLSQKLESISGTSVSTSSNGEMTAIRSASDRIEVRNSRTWTRISECRASGKVEDIRFSHGGEVVSWVGEVKGGSAVGACDATSGSPFGLTYKMAGLESYLGLTHTNSIITQDSSAKKLQLRSIVSGKLGTSLKQNREIEALSVARVSPNGKFLAGGTEDNNVNVWDVATGKLIQGLKMLPGQKVGQVASIAINNDSTRVAAGTVSGILVNLWDIQSGKLLRTFTSADTVNTHNKNTIGMRGEGSLNVGAISFGSQRIAASYGRSIIVWDERSGRELWKVITERGDIGEITFSANGEQIISTSKEGIIDRWDAASGALLGSVFPLASGEWIILTPEGFFDASSPKAAQNLNVVRGLEVSSIDQFRNALFRPDLVKAKLAGDLDGVVKAAAAKLDLNKVVESGNAPRVAIASPADGSSVAKGEINFEAIVTEQGGGIGRIEWRLNGQPVGIETRGFQRVQDGLAAPPAGSGTSEAAIRISQKMVLDAGDNVIEVLAYNARGLVASQPSRVTLKATGPVAVTKPRLFVLAVGVNDYYDSRLKLNYAVPDARAIAASFEKAGAGFYDSVKAVTVLDADVTRANLEKVFANLASQVKTTDVFVFFIAGHGRTLDGHYYFLPQDFKYRDQNSYAENGLSQQQWQKWITTVQARKSVLIYDTCESGAVTADPVVMASNTRGLQRVEEQAVAYDKLRDAVGKTILAASTDTQPALEGYRGHGVFSYVVMEALEKAQTNAGGLIEVTGLISYIDDKVPDLSFQAFKQRQIPQNKLTGSNFAIAKPTAMSLRTGPAQAASTPGTHAVSTRPTHVVIAPADVYETFGGRGAATQQLRPGTLLSLVKTEQGWMLVAKDGKAVGYVAESKITQIQ